MAKHTWRNGIQEDDQFQQDNKILNISVNLDTH
jgi:hypothetical protein